MDRALILETTFLIDFERERQGKKDGPATGFLQDHTDHSLLLTHTIAGELAAGRSLGDRKRWESFLQPFRVLPWTTDIDWHYGDLFRYLQANGLLINTNDLWIAATARAYDLPVVTRNSGHYRRIPGLRLLPYR